MNATLSLTTHTAFGSQTEARPSGLSLGRKVKIPRVVVALSLVILVQACVVLLVVGASWAGVI